MTQKLPINLDDLLRQRTVEREHIECKDTRYPDPASGHNRAADERCLEEVA